MKQIKRTISILTIGALLLTRSWVPVYAEDVVAEPTPETTVTQTTLTETTPTPTETQSQTENSTETTTQSTEVTPTPTPDPLTERQAYIEAQRAEFEAAFKTQYYGNTGSTTQQTTSGNNTVSTGDATNSGTATTTGNTNISTPESGTTVSSSPSSAVVENTGNGTDSENTSSATVSNTDTTTQDNSAQVGSSLDLSTTTGENSSSLNVGDSTVNSGDANTSGTAITSVNTNMDGVMVSEFNVIDDHNGDIILSEEAFIANCISGCPGTGSATNVGNGADSTNTATTDMTNTDNTFQNNDASVGNELILDANSGDNTTSLNTGGDSTVNTGDANVSANSLTFANNNIDGNVIYGVVNIYGDLNGDIILPGFSEGSSDALVSNTGNGADSTNTASSSTTNNNTTTQNNDVTITNELLFDANTGENSASNNTDGNTVINTGDTNVDANVLNITNSNISGGTWWLVLINEAGNWFGALVGSPDGSHVAGSEGMIFQITDDGQINATNNQNGAGSENTAETSTTNNSTTTQNNTANIHNTLDLSANTGGNEANYNTGGNNYINTGDAKIIANLVNFVNNNIVGNGKLVVTVVNVFGKWFGDFVGPGQQKQNKNTTQTASSSSNNSNNSNGGSSNTQQVQGVSSVSSNSESTNTSIASNFVARTAGVLLGVSQTNDLSEKKVAVLGEKSLGSTASENDQLSINLAWLVLLAPVILLGRFAKKTIIARNLPQS